MAGTTRYLRFIILGFLALIVFFFITSSSSASSVPGRSTIKSTTEILRQQGNLWKGVGERFGRPPKPEAGPGGATIPEGTVPGGTAPGSTVPGVADIVPGKSDEVDTGAGSTDDKKWTTTTEVGSSQQTPVQAGSGQPIVPGTKSTSGKAASEYKRENATFVTLARNGDVWEISRSIRQVEDRFNRNYNYDWVFLNDDDFDDRFINTTTALTSGRARYGKISSEHWGFPSFIDQDKAAKVREDMAERKIIYGDSISYRHMCRYESGFFFRHPLMMEYEYYWRVEPSIELFCDVAYDPFKFMKQNGKKYSFVLSLYEYVETIPTLWDSVKGFMQKYPQHIVEDNTMAFISDDDGENYNNCHFWSNFEIGNLDWLRSDAYVDYFTHLDHDGGFFYERWGDAPVHSIAAALMLKKDEIHFFNDIAYYHVPFTHCPNDQQTLLDLRCHCNPGDNFDWNGYSCTSRYFDANKMEKPPGHDPTKK